MQPADKIAKKSTPKITELRALVQADFDAIDEMILKELASDVELVNTTTQHIVKSGGKRLRPLTLLLMAKAMGCQDRDEPIELATVVEFVHTATLLHDDVVDASEMRRNKPTVNAMWGNEVSVLAGDFLYSRAFQILARRSNIPVMKVLADTTNQISQGEVMQLANCGKSDLSEPDYFKVIERKTATLYSAACEIGAIVATNNNLEARKHAADYGLHLGLAFQMIDDLLDYTADSKVTGKNVGDDLNEGKVTLPLIYTLAHGNENQKKIITSAIESQGREHIDDVVTAIVESGGCKYTFDKAQTEAKTAKQILQHIPANPYREALEKICDFVLAREY